MSPKGCGESGLCGQNSGQQLGVKGAEARPEPRAGMCQEGIAEVFHLKLPFELDSPGHCGILQELCTG